MKKQIYLLFLIVFFISLSFVMAGNLKVTSEHPFLINGSWISASQLHVGDELTTVDGKKVRITHMAEIVSPKTFPVYNLEAGVYHDFVVTDSDNVSVIVHNSNIPVSSRPLPPSVRQSLAPIADEIDGLTRYVRIPWAPLPPEPVATKPLVMVESPWAKFVDPSLEVKPSIIMKNVVVDEWYSAIQTSSLSSDVKVKVMDTLARILNNYKYYSEEEWVNSFRKSVETWIATTGLKQNEYVVIMGAASQKSTNYAFVKASDLLRDSGKIRGLLFPKSGGVSTDEFQALLQAGQRKFVVFDDGSYSGTDIRSYWYTNLDKAIKQLEIKGVVFAPHEVQLDLVIPYFAPPAQETVAALVSSGSDKLLMTLYDVETAPTQLDILVKSYTNSGIDPGLAKTFAINDFAFYNSHLTSPPLDPSLSAFTLQHKVADYVSLGPFSQVWVSDFPGYSPNLIETIYHLKNTVYQQNLKTLYDATKVNPEKALLVTLTKMFLSLLSNLKL